MPTHQMVNHQRLTGIRSQTTVAKLQLQTLKNLWWSGSTRFSSWEAVLPPLTQQLLVTIVNWLDSHPSQPHHLLGFLKVEHHSFPGHMEQYHIRFLYLKQKKPGFFESFLDFTCHARVPVLNAEPTGCGCI